MYWNISKFNNCVDLLTTPGSFIHFYTRWSFFWDLLFVMWKYKGLKGEDIFRKFFLFGLILIYVVTYP